MPYYLGIDTSNYTTSAAVFDSSTGCVVHKKKLLPVAEGALGLKQSDAVFAHVKQLPQILEELFFAVPQAQNSWRRWGYLSAREMHRTPICPAF